VLEKAGSADKGDAGISMADQPRFVSAVHFDRNLYTSSQARERVLNAAIIQAEISESFEEYLEIFDAFYDDDIEVKQRHRGRTDSSKGSMT
jgi:hypothetical protein